jgi:GxxExxY protein
MAKRKVDNFLFEKESYKIRGAFFRVYNTLGGGIKEKVIENALNKELQELGFQIEKQKRINIEYKGEKIGYYIPDLIINQQIIIEIKSKPFITHQDEKQFWSYLKGSDYQLGFLVNFGPQKLEIKRFAHAKNQY